MEEITYPSLESDYVKLYANLFFPVKGKRIWFVPLTLTYFKETGEYEIRIDHSTFRANKGEEQSHISDQLKRVIKRVIDFAKLCNCFMEYIPTEHVHPLYRRGRVKLKYVWDKLMPISEAKELWRKYKENLKNRLESNKIMLRDYLTVVSIIYKSLGKKVTGDLKEDYKRYADFRDCGLLDLPLDDRDAFYRWYHDDEWVGCHPFEVVAGGLISAGILLFPPDEDGRYTLSVGSYVDDYVKSVKGLLQFKVPFSAPLLHKALKILTGEEYVKVNDYNEGLLNFVYVNYYDVKRKSKVEWEQSDGVCLKRKYLQSKQS
ncbi:hypothetical protein [Candidatus Acidianus copahuensis]|nr:hypothetical protein [Candidatus Acidianus copahuensis]